MLYLIHGDQVEAARNKLVELKKEFTAKEIRELSGKNLDPALFTQALESSSLFGGDILVVIEGFISSSKKREKMFAATLTQIIEASTTADIILYEDKEVDKTTLTKLGSNIKIFFYKTPVVIFQLLDSLRPGSAKTTLGYLAQVVASEPVEIVFVMLIKRVRQLIQLKDGVTPDGLQSWQAGRLTTQARNFTIEQLIAMHAQLLTTDIAIKTGSSPFTLTQLVEQLIINL